LTPGDRVRVVAGQQSGLLGHLQLVDNGFVFLLPAGAEPDEQNVIQLLATDVKKNFVVGDFVKVRIGAYAGMTGWIVSCDGIGATIHDSDSVFQLGVMTRDLDFHEIQLSGPPPPQQPLKIQRDTRDPYIGRRVLIKSGHFKGYTGTVKESNTVRQKALIELAVLGSRVLAFSFSQLVDHRCV
jgi:transcription elongation factor